MNCKIIAAALCMLSFRASYGMSDGVAFLGRIYSDAWEYFSQDVSGGNCCMGRYLLNEKDENAIISLIKNRKIAEAKALIKELFYDERIKRAPTSRLIRELTRWHMDQEVLSLVIDVLSRDISYDIILALTSALQWAAQEGHIQVIKSLNSFFNHLASWWQVCGYTWFGKESYENSGQNNGAASFHQYLALCSGYIASFDRAAYNGQIKVLEKLINSCFLSEIARNWSVGRRCPSSPFQSALHAAILGKEEDTILYLLKKKLCYKPSVDIPEREELIAEYSHNERIMELL
ncbi:hypothetical protein H0W26_04310 [Candidatus Dependentiae bacterium]|nr:hypothetical protein [Candidatus Dependentiae bacterium]